MATKVVHIAADELKEIVAAVVEQKLIPSLKVDRTAFSVGSLFDPPDDIAYWHSRTPQERLRQMEILRRINYGHRATERLQRVIEFAER